MEKKHGFQAYNSISSTMLVKSRASFKFLHCSLRTATLYFPPYNHFVVWDHTGTIMAYWPLSVSMGTEKPFQPLLRLESYLLLFYFGIADADYQAAHCSCSDSYYHRHDISTSGITTYASAVRLPQLLCVVLLCLEATLKSLNGSMIAAVRKSH